MSIFDDDYLKQLAYGGGNSLPESKTAPKASSKSQSGSIFDDEYLKQLAGAGRTKQTAASPLPNTKQQKQAENAARLDALAGRTGAQKDLSAPLSKPQAIRDFTTGDIVQTVVPKAQSEKQSGGLLAGIQNLMEAASPVAKGVDMLRYLQNQEQAKAQADGIADQRIMELREQAKTNPAVLHSDEYIKAMSRPVSLFSGMVRDIPQIDPEGKSSLDRLAPVMQSKRAEAQNELLEGKTGLSKIGTQALISGADMLGSAGLAGMTGVPFLGVMAGQSGADAGQRALDEGHSYDKAALFAAGTGGITAGIESFGGVAGKWGDDAARNRAGGFVKGSGCGWEKIVGSRFFKTRENRRRCTLGRVGRIRRVLRDEFLRKSDVGQKYTI